YQITYLQVDENGWIEPAQLRAAITENTILVSIMMANNEVGTILPIKEMCAIAHENGIFFHT
ncbi:MAG: aminotransferase class V-fold PLP-dependent enzyme, partial [Phycisphaerae bacterium]|nr:aminotransferase class V-fold PLP-dependent enzyme [Phycisphaerae bacterium]